MKLTEKHTFKTTEIQKQTLKVLKNKYKINVSVFIRSAIIQKLEREKDDLFSNYKEIQSYLEEENKVPF